MLGGGHLAGERRGPALSLPEIIPKKLHPPSWIQQHAASHVYSEALKILSEPSQGKEFFPAHKSARDGSLSPRKNRPTVGHACTRRPSHLVHPRERPTRYQIAPTHGFARRLEAAHGLRTITTLVRALDAVKSARRCRPGESRALCAKRKPGRPQRGPRAPAQPRRFRLAASLSF